VMSWTYKEWTFDHSISAISCLVVLAVVALPGEPCLRFVIRHDGIFQPEYVPLIL